MNTYKSIIEWGYEELIEILTGESNELEYKSSKVSLENLKNKISISASAFWNSGGGFLLQV